MNIDVILALTLNLVRARCELDRIEYQNLLESDKKIDKKEIGSLMAGYRKAQSDLDGILMSIVEV